MRTVLEIRDLGTFGQAVESFSKDREKLVELKGLLEQQLLEIKGQLMGLNASDSPQLAPEEVIELRGRIHRAETAKGYVVRKMVKVDSVLARLSREGGWLMFVHGWSSGWIASKTPPGEWALEEMVLYGSEAREISFSIAITQDQWDRVPKEVQKFEKN